MAVAHFSVRNPVTPMFALSSTFMNQRSTPLRWALSGSLFVHAVILAFVATLTRPLLQMPPDKTLEVELVPAQPLPMAPAVAQPPPVQPPPPRPRVTRREPPKLQPKPAPPVLALNTPAPVQPRIESVPVTQPSPPAPAPE